MRTTRAAVFLVAFLLYVTCWSHEREGESTSTDQPKLDKDRVAALRGDSIRECTGQVIQTLGFNGWLKRIGVGAATTCHSTESMNVETNRYINMCHLTGEFATTYLGQRATQESCSREPVGPGRNSGGDHCRRYRYNHFFAQAAKESGIHPAVFQVNADIEASFDTSALNRGSLASGLMQFTPETAIERRCQLLEMCEVENFKKDKSCPYYTQPLVEDDCGMQRRMRSNFNILSGEAQKRGVLQRQSGNYSATLRVGGKDRVISAATIEKFADKIKEDGLGGHLQRAIYRKVAGEQSNFRCKSSGWSQTDFCHPLNQARASAMHFKETLTSTMRSITGEEEPPRPLDVLGNKPLLLIRAYFASLNNGPAILTHLEYGRPPRGGLAAFVRDKGRGPYEMAEFCFHTSEKGEHRSCPVQTRCHVYKAAGLCGCDLGLFGSYMSDWKFKCNAEDSSRLGSSTSGQCPEGEYIPVIPEECKSEVLPLE